MSGCNDCAQQQSFMAGMMAGFQAGQRQLAKALQKRARAGGNCNTGQCGSKRASRHKRAGLAKGILGKGGVNVGFPGGRVQVGGGRGGVNVGFPGGGVQVGGGRGVQVAWPGGGVNVGGGGAHVAAGGGGRCGNNFGCQGFGSPCGGWGQAVPAQMGGFGHWGGNFGNQWGGGFAPVACPVACNDDDLDNDCFPDICEPQQPLGCAPCGDGGGGVNVSVSINGQRVC